MLSAPCPAAPRWMCSAHLCTADYYPPVVIMDDVGDGGLPGPAARAGGRARRRLVLASVLAGFDLPPAGEFSGAITYIARRSFAFSWAPISEASWRLRVDPAGALVYFAQNDRKLLPIDRVRSMPTRAQCHPEALTVGNRP